MHTQSKSPSVESQVSVDTTCQEFLKYRLPRGDFYQGFFDFPLVMSTTEAFFLQCLINVGANKGNTDGWVKCTSKYAKLRFHIPRRQLDRILWKLRKRGFIRCTLFGFPPQRHIKVRFDKIERAITQTKRLSTTGLTSEIVSPIAPFCTPSMKTPSDTPYGVSSGGKNSPSEETYVSSSGDPRLASSDESQRMEGVYPAVGCGASPEGGSVAAPRPGNSPRSGELPTDEGNSTPEKKTQHRASGKPEKPVRVPGAAPPNRETGGITQEEFHAVRPRATPVPKGFELQNRVDSPRMNQGGIPTVQNPRPEGGVRPPRYTPETRSAGGFPTPSNCRHRNGITPMENLFTRQKTSQDSRPKCATEEIDHTRADKLRKLARKHSWVSGKSPTNWAEPLAILRRQLGDKSGLIDQVLDWYLGWYAPEKRPAIWNGKQFKDRWEWLYNLYVREHPQPAAELPPCKERDQVLHNLLTSYEWPECTEAELAALLQYSHDEMDALYTLAERKRAVATKMDKFFWEWFCKNPEFYSYWHMVENWFGDLRRWLNKLKEPFKGDLRKLAIHRRNPRYIERIIKQCEESGEYHLGQELVKELQAGTGTQGTQK